MATELLSTASGAATSADFTCDGVTVIFLKSANGVIPFGARVAVEVKDSAAGYTKIGELNAQTISGVPGTGTYRLRRLPTGDSVGAEKAA